MDFQSSCPIPISDYPVITMAHGSGGVLSHQLIDKLFVPLFGTLQLNDLHDGAVFDVPAGKLAFTTDSFVIDPIFFPGGNIGELAINGTVNDIACCGAKPLYLSVGLILEEGLPMDDLWKIAVSMKEASDRAGVKIITGDTKVVDRGKGDKIFINTTGIGSVREGVNISPGNCKHGDVIIVSGTIGDHGVAVMSARSGLEFETQIVSDTAPLNGMVEEILNASSQIHVLRDPTRGGVATTLNEIASSSNTGIILEEDHIPVANEVRGACEILGLDPLYIANEGKLLVIIPESESEAVLKAMRNHPAGKNATLIGRVTEDHPGIVRMITTIGSSRIIDMLTGEQLPRIC
ncbi:MAG: hydrogenase expression/formation protein HypE [Bacteroidales bacterium]|nr:hydrogenase expression/formation protein HypE [Bacteroidales bacterium]